MPTAEQTQAVVWVDKSVGSKELELPLQRLGIRTKLVSLDSADFFFEIRGPGESHLTVGIERKTISDLIQSLQSGRLQGLEVEYGAGGQLNRLRKTYDIVWLLVEGEWIADRSGHLCKRGRRGVLKRLHGGLTEDALTKRILSLVLQGGMLYWRTQNTAETVRWIASQLRWGTDKAWENHHTLQTVHRHTGLKPVSLFRERALALPGVGLAVSKALESAFDGSELRLHGAEPADIAGIVIKTPDGQQKRLGMSKATQIHEALLKLKGV